MVTTKQSALFLEQTEPFKFLSKTDLELLKTQLEEVTYAPGEQVYYRGQSPLDHIAIVQTGRIEKYLLNQEGQQEFQEHFTPGDTMGEVTALMKQSFSLSDAVALEETTVLQFPVKLFFELCTRNADFDDFFTSRFGRRVLNEKYASYIRRNARGETFDNADYFFQLSLRDICIRHIHTISAEATIQEASQKMLHHQIGYLVLENEEEEWIGIITDFDFKSKVAARGLDTQASVRGIMSAPLISISEDAKIYEAVLLLFRRKIKYLLVEKDGEYVGLVTRNKLLFYQSESPFLFIQSITHASSQKELQGYWQQVPLIVRQLLDRGIKAENANQIITTVVDAITQNVIERAIFELRKVPVRFIFVALGSEGRREQTLKTDQDNAIIFEDVRPEILSEIQSYFLELAKIINDELHEIGFNYCEGDFMAMNPKWCQPVSVWKKYYKDWIAQQDGDSLLNTTIFFDARSIYGDQELLSEVRQSMDETLKKDPRVFFNFLAKSSLDNRPPLGFFKDFQLFNKDKEDRKKVLDIKRAMLIIIDFARIYCLKHQITATNTGDRLKALAQAEIIQEADYEELKQAYYYMMQLRLRHQIHLLIDEQKAPDNYLAPKDFTQVERVTLKEVFKILKKYQTKMGIDFTGSLNY